MFNYASFFLLVLGARIVSAVPVQPRVVTSLDQAATAEAQVRDADATRAFTSVSIKTSDGHCLSVDPLSGDFRENLTPVAVVACDAASPNQKWDVLTSGKHNNVPGQALFVSSLTNACLNFDARRTVGNQVLLFSCGGRADGGGVVTDSQLFAFDATTAAKPFALLPQAGKGQVCMTVTNGLVDQSACTAASASGLQLFSIDGTTSAAPAPAGTSSSAAAQTTAAATTAISTSAKVDTTSAAQTTAAATTAVSGAAPATVTGKTQLDAAAVAEAQKRDDSATRAKTAVSITTSSGKCLSVDPQSGDFRENLTPITTVACDGSPNQQWDVITKGVHNDQAGKALIVSSLTNACLNFDDRRAAGNQVLLFSCGGRADGGGQVQPAQLFAFDGTTDTIALSPAVTNNAKCFFDNNGLIDAESCDATKPSATELFTLGGAAAAPAPAQTTSSAVLIDSTTAAVDSTTAAVDSTTAVVDSTTAVVATTSSTSAVAKTTDAATTAVSGAAPATVTGKTQLDAAAVAEAQKRDDSATRAKTAVAITTSNGKCLSVDPQSGDFRENLTPITTATCDGSPNQQWDIITKGVHNDQAGKALIVSSLTNACLNFDDRRAAGNQVLLFSCGGRADGSGQVQPAQLFAFDGSTDTIALSPAVTNNAKCFFDNNGLIDAESCDATKPSATELFTLGGAAAAPAAVDVAAAPATASPAKAATGKAVQPAKGRKHPRDLMM